jgi:ferric-dicitrate binding protein FerR (iron transport regulator)
LFRVKENQGVSFEVPVGSTTVEAVGTVFSVVRKSRDTAEVVVREGEVRFHTQERKQTIALKKGQIADVDHDDIHLRPAAVSRLDGGATWIAGVVSLNGDMLAAAADKCADPGAGGDTECRE